MSDDQDKSEQDKLEANSPELMNSPELENSPELIDSPELENSPELIDSPELENNPALVNSPELIDNPELENSPELIDNPELINNPEPHITETKPTDHKPAQIPLLDDVVFNTSLPFAKPKPRAKSVVEQDGNVPRPTDLFGGSPDTAQTGPMAPHYRAPDIDQATSALRGNTEKMVENLVAEYSKEIIERLRDDLTSILQDLDRNEDPNKDSDPS